MSVRFTSTIATTLLPVHSIYRLYRVLIRCLDTILNYMWWYEFNLEIFCKINPEKIHNPPQPPKRLKHISRTRFERWTLTHSRLNGLYKILSSKKRAIFANLRHFYAIFIDPLRISSPTSLPFFTKSPILREEMI